MKLTSIQARMGLLFVSFFILVAISVGATLWGVKAQNTDALVVNLAGRQRMLVQQMARLTKEIEVNASEAHIALLLESMETFEQTQHVLRFGGATPYLPGQSANLPITRDPELQVQLELVSNLWFDYRQSLDLLLSWPANNASFQPVQQNMDRLATALAVETDLVVGMFETAAIHKLAQIQWVQAGFLASALSLLVVGFLFIRSSVISPLRGLGIAANQIGAGDLGTPVQIQAPDEVNLLANSFESMRVQLQESHQQLQVWANTLEKRVDQRTQELNALYQVSRDISSRLEIDQVLDSITEKAGELLKADVAFLCLLDDREHNLRLHSASGPLEAVRCSSTSARGSFAEQVLTGDNALPCGGDGCVGSCGIISEYFHSSHLAAPMRVGERLIGALCVGSSQEKAFNTEATMLLARLANSAAIALENARLYSQAERLGILEERQRIAAEMHDGISQTMSYLCIKVDLAKEQIENNRASLAIETLDQVENALGHGLVEIRRAIDSLQAETPLRFTLQEQLGEIVQEFKSMGNVVHYETDVMAPVAISNDQSEQVLRIVREAILNAIHHSESQRITVRLEMKDGVPRITIEDDGCGFIPEALSTIEGQLHFGLKIMQARANRMGAHLHIDSTFGEGTRVVLSL